MAHCLSALALRRSALVYGLRLLFPDFILAATSSSCFRIVQHWVWLAHGGNGQSDCQQLLVDYQAHNITVGTLSEERPHDKRHASL